MNRQYHKETICIQSGWQQKNGEPRVLPIYQSNRWDGSLIWRRADISTAGYRIRRTTVWQLKSVSWKEAWRLC